MLALVALVTAPVQGSLAAAANSSLTWFDQSVTFSTGGLRIAATLRHRAHDATSGPGVLLIAGSGPTDRNENSAVVAGPVDTLQTLATWLSDDEVASSPYDRL